VGSSEEEREFRKARNRGSASKVLFAGRAADHLHPAAVPDFSNAKEVTIFYQYAHAVRHIFANGSKHPTGIDWWLGDSRAQWQGDTLRWTSPTSTT
jgi:hypothetical protein